MSSSNSLQLFRPVLRLAGGIEQFDISNVVTEFPQAILWNEPLGRQGYHGRSADTGFQAFTRDWASAI